jgi:hypothetical protein
MIFFFLNKSIRKCCLVTGRKGNQVRSLNDPVTVSGEAISVEAIAEG